MKTKYSKFFKYFSDDTGAISVEYAATAFFVLLIMTGMLSLFEGATANVVSGFVEFVSQYP